MGKNKIIIILYSLTVCLGAFLMFAIQPLIGKIVTPQYGGVAQVWCLCLLFFQITLLGGYTLSYFINKLSFKNQGYIYIGLMLLSIFLVHIPFGTKWAPNDPNNPITSLLSLLLLYLAVPAILLSTISVTMQNWYKTITDKNPYFLYSISNLGALSALILYPTLIEPHLTISLSLKLWTWSYWILTIIAASASFIMLKNIKQKTAEPDNQTEENLEIVQKPEMKNYLTWIFLSASGSILLLSFTNHLVYNLAPIPLLWILPLAVYLLAFILCFSHERVYIRPLYAFSGITLLAAFALIDNYKILASILFGRLNSPLFLLITINLLILFFMCMVCNGELYKLRPQSNHLSLFYLFIALGGALGGIFINIIAPVIFNDYYEFDLILSVMALMIGYIILKYQPRLFYYRWLDKTYAAILIVMIIFCFYGTSDELVGKGNKKTNLLVTRNFYGTAKVILSRSKEMAAVYLLNGTIIHGGQMINPANGKFINKPTFYYTEDTALGAAVNMLHKYKPNTPLKIGIIGLGTGTTAAYGQRGDSMTFYENDPKMVDIAADKFGFIRNSKARITIVLGDGRLSLKKQKPQNYDILVIDGFNSDSIPTHLMTKEATELYLSHLNKDGLILFHVSNIFLNLNKVVSNISIDLGLKEALFTKYDKSGKADTVYSVVSRNDWFFNAADQPEFAAKYPNLKFQYSSWFPESGLWTDNYTNLFSVLSNKIN